jgi:RimJ/RimL family protein N-acetyltransferase
MTRLTAVTLIGTTVALEPLARGHLADLDACCEPSFYDHMAGGPFALGGVHAWYAQLEEAQRAQAALSFALIHRAQRRAIGTTTLSDISVVDERLEIGGTWVARAHQRTAANTEMKLLLLGYCFEDLGVGRVTLKTGSENVVSQQAIERLGATREGVLRRHIRLNDGRWRDSVYYAVLAPEWPVVRERLRTRLRES